MANSTLNIGHLMREFKLSLGTMTLATGQSYEHMSKRKTNGDCLGLTEAINLRSILRHSHAEVDEYLTAIIKKALK